MSEKPSDSKESLSKTSKPNRSTRRDFLKNLAVGIGGALLFGSGALSDLGGQLTLDVKKDEEVLSPTESRTICIDTTSQALHDQYPNIPFEPYSVDKRLQEQGYPILQDFFDKIHPPKTQSQMNDEDITSYLFTNKDELIKWYGQRYYVTWMAIITLMAEKNNGAKMLEAQKRSNAFFGRNTEPVTVYPLQDIYQFINVKVIEEGNQWWHNTGMEATRSSHDVIQILEKAKLTSPCKHAVFSLGWQLGTKQYIYGVSNVESARMVTYWDNANSPDSKEPLFFVFSDMGRHRPEDGHKSLDGLSYVFSDGTSIQALPQDLAEQTFDNAEYLSIQDLKSDPKVNPTVGMEIRDPYRKSAVQQSIQEVIDLAQAFPQDFLVLSAGDIESDLRGIPPLPNNVILVGEWSGGKIKPTGLVYGAEVYVPNSKLGLQEGSGNSVAFISATVQDMLVHGVLFETVKETLLSALSRTLPYHARGEEEPDSTLEHAPVIDIDSIEKNLSFEF